MDFNEEDNSAMKNDSTIEEQETLDKDVSKSNLSLSRLFQGTSRYGRTIKPKSLAIVNFESPKNLKMPKIAQQETTIEVESKMEDTSIDMNNSLNNSLDSSAKVEDDKATNEDCLANCPWTLGELVWAKIGGFPFWPGIITLDPNTMSYVSQKGKSRMIHVRYCADKGRHSWVPFGNTIGFLGLNDFEKRAKEITPEVKKKEAKYAAGFYIKSSLKLQWDDAVAEACGLMAKSIEIRRDLYKPKIKKSKDKDSLDKSLTSSTEKSIIEDSKKRKLSIDETEVSSKKTKQDVEEEEESDDSKENKIALGNVSLETPPTPPSSHKDSSDEAPIARKFKNKKKNIRDGKDGVFEIFCERNKEQAEQLDPDASEADVKAYLLDLWDNMSILDRSKYRADYLQEEEMRLYALDVDEDEEDENENENENENEESEPEPEKSDQEINEKVVKKRKSKANKRKDEISDQEETTSVESETTEKTVRKRKSKVKQEFSDQEDVISGESDEKSTRKRKSKVEKEEFDSMILEMGNRPKNYKLFKGMKNERVCQICEQTGKLIRCKGPCYSYFHLSCVKPGESSPEPSEAGDIEENNAYKEDLKEIKEKIKEKEEESFDDENFRCIDCLSGIAPPCFVCHERDGERTKCSVIACGKHYHLDCLKTWPQGQWQGGRLTCPYHICHTCVSDNPQNSHPRSLHEKFARCIRCPSTYHASISCLPAGSNILTGSQIICPKHYKSLHPPVNATWCFLCTEGGSLICCDTCPMSFHLECLGINAPEGGFICEDCETGRLPLYGEVVWVKHGNYRWWPSVICYPQEIPSNIAIKPHKTGEFCVMFLGTKDYNWIHRGKAFLFQDGDASTKVIGSKKVEESYRKALVEAKYLHDRLMRDKALAKDKDNGSRHLKPPPYVKLKVNKPVGNVKIPEVDSMVACNCDPNQPNPCSPEADCINRTLFIECSPDACPAGKKCQNQLFVQRKYPAMKPVHTEERGWGLKTLEQINSGQFVIEYVGEVIDESEYKLRLQQKKERKNENYYFLTIDNNRLIDAEPKGNLSRFMNHSCQPNCETQKWTVNGDTRIGLFALRDIKPGEELTFNYNLACDGETRKPCLCKAPNCSGFIGLKVPKQAISFAQQKKIEKAEKVKKQRKYKKSLMCWNCNMKIENPDEANRCDQKTCGKAYHPHCIAIEDGPEQIFHCPWHFCAECYKRTSIRCSYCCNAFCQTHVCGNLREHAETRTMICYNHNMEYATDYGDADMGEALMDDDGEGDDDVVITDEYNVSECDRVPEITKSSSPLPMATTQVSQPDDTSPRGTIVEVQVSSEDGEEDESQREDNDEEAEVEPEEEEQPSPESPAGKGRLRRRRRRRSKQTGAESDFTLDQIAAIIGIVK